MADRYLKSNKVLFYQSSTLQTFVGLLIRAIGIENYNATKAHADFFVVMIKSLTIDLEEGKIT